MIQKYLRGYLVVKNRRLMFKARVNERLNQLTDYFDRLRYKYYEHS